MQFIPTKGELDRALQSIAQETHSRMARWQAFAAQMDTITDQELEAIGYTATQVAYIRSFTVALKNIELRYRNQTPLNSDDPSYFVQQMLPLLVF